MSILLPAGSTFFTLESLTALNGVPSNIARRMLLALQQTTDAIAWFGLSASSTSVTPSPREKQIKRWGRAKKIWLIEQMNPTWADLSEQWGKKTADLSTSLRSGRDDNSS